MRSVYFSARVFFSVILTLIIDSPGFAGNDSRPVQTESITVTATKSEKNIDGVSASVVVVSQKQIEKMGAVHLKDIFEKTPGLTIQYGTFPAASSASNMKSFFSITTLRTKSRRFPGLTILLMKM